MENKRYKKEQDIHLTKEEYLAQLKKYLKRLPKEDYNNAMDYFTENELLLPGIGNGIILAVTSLKFLTVSMQVSILL